MSALDDPDVTIVGEDAVGRIAQTPDGFRWYVTPCCGSAASVGDCGFFCKGCYGEADPMLGGEPPAVVAGVENGGAA